MCPGGPGPARQGAVPVCLRAPPLGRAAAVGPSVGKCCSKHKVGVRCTVAAQSGPASEPAGLLSCPPRSEQQRQELFGGPW